MAVFRISTKVLNDIVGTSGLASAANAGSGFRRGTSAVRIMQGTIPTQTELDLVTVFPFRDADKLIEYIGAGIVTYGNGKIGWNQQILAAINSGAASWFMWTGSTGTTGTKTIMVGTISMPGGGGDMTLTNTNIVFGTNYAIGPADFILPTRSFFY